MSGRPRRMSSRGSDDSASSASVNQTPLAKKRGRGAELVDHDATPQKSTTVDSTPSAKRARTSSGTGSEVTVKVEKKTSAMKVKRKGSRTSGRLKTEDNDDEDEGNGSLNGDNDDDSDADAPLASLIKVDTASHSKSEGTDRPMISPIGGSKNKSSLFALAVKQNLKVAGVGGAGDLQEQYNTLFNRRQNLMKDLDELQAHGGRVMPMSDEPPRNKTTWDYTLQEMEWMANDYKREKKWKIMMFRKIGRQVISHYKKVLGAGDRKEKVEVLRVKKLAANVSKEIKAFWLNIQKLVFHKYNLKMQEKTQATLDKHLEFLVKETERYSHSLAKDLSVVQSSPAIHSGQSSPASSIAPSPSPIVARIASPLRLQPTKRTSASLAEKISSKKVKNIVDSGKSMDMDTDLADIKPSEKTQDDDAMSMSAPEEDRDFEDVEEVDDEETLEQEERKARKERRRKRRLDAKGDDAKTVSDDDDDEDDSSSDEDSEDEEAKQEVNELAAEGDMPIEELIKKYYGGHGDGDNEGDDDDDDDDDESGSDYSSDDESDESEEGDGEDEGKNDSKNDEKDVHKSSKKKSKDISKSAASDTTSEKGSEWADDSEEEKEESDGERVDDDVNGTAALLKNMDSEESRVQFASKIALEAQPQGFTFDTVKVKSEVPFLLRGSMREYQHIGLDWLVSMYDNKLNGILADEMGLGKTIQTISLLAYLACKLGIWGPHLIVVPTSVLINWEMELKRWLPGFKVVSYHGTTKQRKLKRKGWGSKYAFHVVITSYNLIVQDQHVFRRKKWHYLILDEAQHIKNYQSQRWQILLNFNTQRRLLLTGTPLQNNMLELWSLMHFLMPQVFQSQKEFKNWFSTPVTGMIEGKQDYNQELISRLHGVLRPFLLRRLKIDVEKQMPHKYEHTVYCRLSRRQRQLYEDFMAASDTQRTLKSGHFIGLMNCLMQLRKVCNHPDLFAGRPIISPFDLLSPPLIVTMPVLPMKLVQGFGVVHPLRSNLYMLSPGTSSASSSSAVGDENDNDDIALDHPHKGPAIRHQTRLHPSLHCIHNQTRHYILATVTPLLAATAMNTISYNFFNQHTSTHSGFFDDTNAALPLYGLPDVSWLSDHVHNQCLESSAQPAPQIVFKTKGLPRTLKKRSAQNIAAMQQTDIESCSLRCFRTMAYDANDQHDTIPAFCQKLSPAFNKYWTNVRGERLQWRDDRRIYMAQINDRRCHNMHKPLYSYDLLRLLTLMHPIMHAHILAKSSPYLINKMNNVLRYKCHSTDRLIAGPPRRKKIVTMMVTKRRPIINVRHGSIKKSASSTRIAPSPRDISPLPIIASPAHNFAAASSSASSPAPRERRTSVANRLSSPFGLMSPTTQAGGLRSPGALQSPTPMDIDLDRPLIASPIEPKQLWEEYQVEETVELDEDEDEVYPIHCAILDDNDIEVVKAGTTITDFPSKYLLDLIKLPQDRTEQYKDTLLQYICIIPQARAMPMKLQAPLQDHVLTKRDELVERCINHYMKETLTHYRFVSIRRTLYFPDKRLLQFDCGKLQMLATMLRQLKSGGHRVLLFTQMTKMLNIFEEFLNIYGYIYLRLDGSTKVEERSQLMERFNTQEKIFIFILSTRSGGVGINLTGADTVIFYDTDWNPAMDLQAQDRCHRIGQTREVNIYRLITKDTVEENILRKSNQKREMNNVVIGDGEFNTEVFQAIDPRELLGLDSLGSELNKLNKAPALSQQEYERALESVEDDADRQALKKLRLEDKTHDKDMTEEINGDGVPGAEKSLFDRADFEDALTPIQKYALRFAEVFDPVVTRAQVERAEAEMKEEENKWEIEQKNKIAKLSTFESTKVSTLQSSNVQTVNVGSRTAQDLKDLAIENIVKKM